MSSDQIQWWVTNFISAFEVLGVLAFALSGLIEAKRKGLDIVGVAMVTAATAFGGGTLRDILLNRRPLFWVEHDWWIWVILGLTLAALVLLRSRHLA
ncbi:MAG: hypothetical protein RLZZ579_1148, partial [Actinomycetota bacterium]